MKITIRELRQLLTDLDNGQSIDELRTVLFNIENQDEEINDIIIKQLRSNSL